MKRCISFILVTLLLCAMCATVSADESSIVQTFTDSNYGFSTTAYTDSEGRIIRKYVSQEPTNKPALQSYSSPATYTEINQEKTKAILLSLGMGQEFIDQLSSETLAKFSASQEITGISSYIKTDAEGNTSIVPESLALQESARINAINATANTVSTMDIVGNRYFVPHQLQLSSAQV